MQSTKFKATTVVAPDTWCHTALAEAFNLWVEEARPSAILHVHYYHDPGLRVRGYQIIYEDSSTSDIHSELAQVMVPTKSGA